MAHQSSDSEGNSRKRGQCVASFKPTAGILLYGFVAIFVCTDYRYRWCSAPAQFQHRRLGCKEARHSLSSMSDATQGLIMLDVVVTDKSGKPITGLGSNGLYFDGERSAKNKILSFHAFDGNLNQALSSGRSYPTYRYAECSAPGGPHMSERRSKGFCDRMVDICLNPLNRRTL